MMGRERHKGRELNWSSLPVRYNELWLMEGHDQQVKRREENETSAWRPSQAVFFKAGGKGKTSHAPV